MSTIEFSGVTAYIDGDANTIDVWDFVGTDYRRLIQEVQDVTEKTLALDPAASFDRVAKEALADRLDEKRSEAAAGLVLVEDGYVFEPYDPSGDDLWERLRPLVKDPTKGLKVTTWGTRFILPDVPSDQPKGVEQIFDASHLRGKRSKATIKLRGTNPILQKTVRDCPGFESLMRRIVTEVETKGLSHIGVICRGGHHRSVTVAELLVNLYPEAKVSHLTIDL
jgi:hypothetical protein